MNYQTIDFVALRESRIKLDYTEAFQLRTDRPAIWMQRLCIFILRKLRAFYVDETVTIERYKIDAPTFMERLFQQKAGIERFFNMRPTRLLIGSEDYAELMCEAQSLSQRVSFRAKYGFGMEILGMTVEVIPWMRGILVMPPK